MIFSNVIYEILIHSINNVNLIIKFSYIFHYIINLILINIIIKNYY